MKTHDFFYELPEELIAQTPLQQRDSSRMLKLDRETGAIEHRHFYDIIDYLQPGDCLVMNDSRVLPARLLGHRPTGGAVEVLLLRDLGDKKWECLCKPGRKMQVGHEVLFGDGELSATVVEVKEDGNRIVEFHYEGIFLEVLERLGKMPLPPYIKAELQDQVEFAGNVIQRLVIHVLVSLFVVAGDDAKDAFGELRQCAHEIPLLITRPEHFFVHVGDACLDGVVHHVAKNDDIGVLVLQYFLYELLPAFDIRFDGSNVQVADNVQPRLLALREAVDN